VASGVDEELAEVVEALVMSPAYKFAMLAAWLEGYAEGLPDYCTAEKFKIKEAAELLMEVYEQRMQGNDGWKQHAGDRA
jgi:hypothetical protein